MLFSFFLGTVHPYRTRTAPGDPDARAMAWARAEIDIAIGTFDFGDIDKVCLVGRAGNRDTTGGLLGVVGQQELDQSFGSCGKNLSTCCSYSSNTNTVLVVKRGRQISCKDTFVELGEGIASPLCSGPRELGTMIHKIKKRAATIKTEGK